jgi:FkbM family methyltransferase
MRDFSSRFRPRATVVYISLLILCISILGYVLNVRSRKERDDVQIWWHKYESRYSNPFQIALPNPLFDSNIRNIMSNAYEVSLGDVYRVLLQDTCNSKMAVLDIGANVGVFAGTAASYGCSVSLIEAQARFFPYLEATKRANKWGTRSTSVQFDLHNVAVGEVAGELDFAMYDGLENVNGSWSSMIITEEAIKTCPTYFQKCRVGKIKQVSGFEIVKQDFKLIKLDVDGPEPFIMRSMMKALSKYSVDNFLVELCPLNWRTLIDINEGVEIFAQLVDEHQYDVVLLNQPSFSDFSPAFLAKCERTTVLFPEAYIMPRQYFRELVSEGITTINCKNVLFTKEIHKFRSS